MMLKLMKKIIDLPILVHIAMAVISISWFQWAKGKLDASYAASLHPVDYMTGQTRFSGEAVKEYYATMSDAGTLDIYVTTQLIDFGFIIGFFGIGFFVCTLIARLSRVASYGQKAGIGAGLAFVFGGLSDMIENGWSFIMLANPSSFADWLAIPYSAFATMKFGLITLGLGLSLASLILAAVGRALKKQNIG